MGRSIVYEKIRAAAELIKSRTAHVPKVGAILGSGLGSIADHAKEAITIPYSDIPYFHGTTVEGHAGELTIGIFEGVPTAFLKGRFHFYEGYSMEEVALPTRTLCALGIETLVLTNAAGGVNTRFRPADLMLIKDHINLMGDNPLKGPNLADLGPRFPDLSEAYDHQHIRVLEEIAAQEDILLHQGVYAALGGPTYETPAEVRMLRTLGADAVGMSTVPEAIAAVHLGVKVAGLSCITNLAAGIFPSKLTHEEVIENSKKGAEKMLRLLSLAIPRFIQKPSG